MSPIIVDAGVNEVVVIAYSTLIMGYLRGGVGVLETCSYINSTVYSQESASCAICYSIYVKE